MARSKKFTHTLTRIPKRSGGVNISGWFSSNARHGLGTTQRGYKRRKGYSLGNPMGKFVKGLR